MSNVHRPVIRGNDMNRTWQPHSPVDPKPTPEQADAARRLCERYAHGDDDYTDLLQLLGIGGHVKRDS